MSETISEKILIAVIVCLSVPVSTYAQISEYIDCSAIYHDESNFERPLTKEEKVSQLEGAFYDHLAKTTKCTPETPGASNPSKSSVGGATSSSGGGASQSISNNMLAEGSESIAITGTKEQKPNFDQTETASFSSSDLGGDNGREHLELETVDNKAALRSQIKAQADLETDPEIKEKLMKEYEALK